MGYESLNKEKRRACWEVRDQYFKCLDSIQWIDADTDQSATCQKYKLLFSEKCPASWVQHFSQGRSNDARQKAYEKLMNNPEYK